MARRRTPRTTSLDLTKLSASSPWPMVEAFLAEGGNITLGRVEPIEYAAVASDELTILAALVRRKDESFVGLMERLNAALLKAFEAGEFTNEINVRQSRR
jgi:hypothetical protein